MKKLLFGLLITLSQYASAQNARPPRSVVSLMNGDKSVYNFMNFINPNGGCGGLILDAYESVTSSQVNDFISSVLIEAGSQIMCYNKAESVLNYIDENGQGLIVVGLPLNASASIRISTKNHEPLASTVHRFFGPRISMKLGYYDQCPVDLESLPVSL